MRALNILQMLAAVLALAGCPAPQATVAREGQVTVEYDRLDYTDQTLASRSYSFRFAVANGTGAPVSFESVSWKFSFNGKEIGDSTTPVTLNLGPGKNGTFEIQVKVEYPREPGEFMAFIKKRSVPYLLNGVLKGSVGELPVKAEYDDGLPQLPEVQIPGASIASGDKGEVGFSFDIFVNNPNVFPMKVDYVSYDLVIEEVPVGGGRIAEMEKVPPTSKLAYTFPAKMDLKTHGAKIKDMLGKKSMNYVVTGVLSVEGIELPVHESGTIKFTR